MDILNHKEALKDKHEIIIFWFLCDADFKEYNGGRSLNFHA
jgi:hypothetical protein